MNSTINQRKIFANRRDAGVRLGRLLAEELHEAPVVLGIPRGGVEIAYHLWSVVGGELSAIITKKLPYPGQPSLACGTAAEDGSYYLTKLGESLPPEMISQIIQDQKSEIENRIRVYRKGKPLPDIKGRIVVIADDGIATGSTLVPAIKLCKSRGAAKVIVAAPVSGDNYVSDITLLADDVKILTQPDDFFAVSQAYQDFESLAEQQIVALLET